VLIAADETEYGTLVNFAVKTGLRRGELMAIRWQDIDLDAAMLHVRRSCQWLPRERFVFIQPKTHRSNRPVDLPPRLVERLREHRRRQLETRVLLGPAYNDRDLVFATPTGDPIPPWSLRRAWRQISDIGHLRFHDLRHAHPTLMLAAGIHPKIVSERLGHSGVAITLDTYSHVIPGLGAQAALKAESLVEGEVMQG
jgi:integrase